MGALDDLLTQDQNKTKPSQIAAQQQKASTSGGLDSLLQSNNGKIDIPQSTSQSTFEPTQQPKQSNNWFQGAVDAVKGFFTPKQSVQPVQLPNDIPLNSQNKTQPTNQNLSIAGTPTSISVPNLIDKIPIAAPPKVNNGNSSSLINPFNTGVTAVDLAPSTIQTLADLQVDPFSVQKAPKATLKDLFSPFGNPVSNSISNNYIKGIVDSVKADAEAIKAVFSAKSNSERVGAGAQAVGRTVGVALSPITSLFSAANDVPVLGSVSKLISLPFDVLGDAGKDLAYPIVNSLPISKQARENIVGGIGEINSLALMLVAGGKIADIPTKIKDSLVAKYGETDATTIVQKAQELAQEKQQNAPQNTVLNPQEARAQASATDLAGTPAEQALKQAADTAEAQGKDVQINVGNSEGQFSAETPQGTKFSLNLVERKQIVPLDDNGQPVKPALDQTTGNPTTDSALQYLKDNRDQYVKDYQARVQQEYGTPDFVSADDAKYPFPGYDGHLAPDYHPAASQFAKEYYDQLLEQNKGTKNNTVLFTAGGTGVGKTSALRGAKYDLKDFSIVYDTNLGAEAGIPKIQKALDAGYNVEIAFTHREAVKAFENGVIPRVKSRNRIVPISEHVARHITALDNIEQIAKHFEGKVNIAYIDNTGGIEDIKLSSFENLPKFKYNKDVLTNTLYEKTKQAINEGKLTQEQGNAIAGKDLSRPDVSGGTEKGTQPTEVTTKKPSFNSAQSRAIQQQFADSLTHLQQTATTQEELIKGVDAAVSKAESLAKGDKTVLAGIRTALNKMMFDFAGHSGNYKQDYAILQTLKDDPSIGDFIKTLEGHINKVDESILKPSSELNPPVDNTKKVDTTGTGEVKTSKVSLGVEQKALEAKLSRSLGDLPEYQRTDMKEQARLAVELLSKDEAKATRIALGQETPPAELLPESVFAAVEDKAIRDGDVTLLRELAQSSLSSEATVMGKRIAALAQRNPDSPVTAIKDIADTRAKEYEKRTGKSANQAISDMKKQIKTELKKAAPKKEDWASFIKSIQC